MKKLKYSHHEVVEMLRGLFNIANVNVSITLDKYTSSLSLSRIRMTEKEAVSVRAIVEMVAEEYDVIAVPIRTNYMFRCNIYMNPESR